METQLVRLARFALVASTLTFAGVGIASMASAFLGSLAQYAPAAAAR